MTEVEKIILEIESIDLTKDEAQGIIETIIRTKLKKFPIFMTSLRAGMPIVRSRYLNDDEDFHHVIQDYSYHPKPEYIKVGRANMAEQQIFYGSKYRVTSLAEVRFIYANREKDSARYSIGRWELTEQLEVAVIAIPELIRKYKTRELTELADYIEAKMAEDNTEQKELIDLFMYFAGKFTEPVIEGEEHKYKITSAFSNFIYSKVPQASGILYQSVQFPENFNVAFRKDVLDEHKIKLVYATRQKYDRIGDFKYKEVENIEAINIDYKSSIITWPTVIT